MKIYALKYKDEFVDFNEKEADIARSYRWETEGVKEHLKIVTGTFTEDK